MTLLLPLLAFLLGYWGVHYLSPWRTLMAQLLARVLIPSIIIYNMVFYQAGTLSLVAFSLLSSVLLFALFYFFSKDKLRALCYSYLNGVWLGFPFAMVLFGPEASTTIIALYIGGSLFGNVSAVIAVRPECPAWHELMLNVLQSPPVIALSLAALLSFWDLSAFEMHPSIQNLYLACKVLVTFTGMCILGMWLSRVSIALQDLSRSLLLILGRFVLALGLVGFAYLYLPIPQQSLTYAVMLMYFLLPPAANIVALETYYQGTGHSAKYIASGTIASTILIGIYGLVLHVWLSA